jgi:hypothetical protein
MPDAPSASVAVSVTTTSLTNQPSLSAVPASDAVVTGG